MTYSLTNVKVWTTADCRVGAEEGVGWPALHPRDPWCGSWQWSPWSRCTSRGPARARTSVSNVSSVTWLTCPNPLTPRPVCRIVRDTAAMVPGSRSVRSAGDRVLRLRHQCTLIIVTIASPTGSAVCKGPKIWVMKIFASQFCMFKHLSTIVS